MEESTTVTVVDEMEASESDNYQKENSKVEPLPASEQDEEAIDLSP